MNLGAEPKKIAILDAEFSLALGEITPKLNVKRRVVARVHKDLIDDLYREGDQGA